MTEKKRNLIGCVKIISFALVFVLLLQVLSLTVFSKKTSSSLSPNLRMAYSFMQEPENSIDVIAVGNSDLYSALVPAELWTKHGYTCNVIASPRQSVCTSYQMLETMYRTQHPKVVIVEVDMLYDTMIDERCCKNKKSPATCVIDMLSGDTFDELIENYLSVFTFHDKWKKAGKCNNADVSNSHGYKYCSNINRVSYTNHMHNSTKTEPVKEENIKWLNNIVNLCRKNGSEVFFTEMLSCTSWDMARHNSAAALAEDMGVDFVDYNLIFESLDIEPETAFRDNGNHLNYFSACKVSDHIGDYLDANYNLPDRRKDSRFDYYNKSIERFYREIDDKNNANKNI